nr:MAG TPA: hypothetical protein [Caudoviricetes sp.]
MVGYFLLEKIFHMRTTIARRRPPAIFRRGSTFLFQKF